MTELSYYWNILGRRGHVYKARRPPSRIDKKNAHSLRCKISSVAFPRNTNDEDERHEDEPLRTSDESDDDLRKEKRDPSDPMKDSNPFEPSSEPSNSSSDSSLSDDDPSHARTSEKDKRTVYGMTPQIKGHGKLVKLFKMESSKKYRGEKDTERTYHAVQQHLSQVSCYF